MTKSVTVNREFVLHVGGNVLATRLALVADPIDAGDEYLSKLADLAVRAAIDLEAAIGRAEVRLAEEQRAAEAAEAAQVAEAKAAAEAAKAAEAQAKAKAKLAAQNPQIEFQ